MMLLCLRVKINIRISYQQQRYSQHVIYDALSNERSLELMEDLYSFRKPKQCNHSEKIRIIERAFEIYNHVNEAKNVYVVSKFISLCFDYGQIKQIHSIWNDIIDHCNHSQFPFELLFKCCIQTNEIEKCLQILQWIRDSNHSMHINDSFITKLIIKCSNSDDRLCDLQLIDSLIQNKLIQCQHYHYIHTALINAYGKCHSIKDALNLFHSIPNDQKDVFYVGAMMKSLIINEYFKAALNLYNESSIPMDDVCHCLVIKACARLNEYNQGINIFSKINEPNIQIKTAMIDLYGSNNQMDKAMELFSKCDQNELNIITINSVITAFINNECYQQALELYDKIEHLHKKKNEISYNLALKACIHLNDFEKGKTVHVDISDLLRKGKKDYIKLRTALIHFYGHFGDMQSALDIFNAIPSSKQDVICTGALMTAYLNNERYYECLELFDTLHVYDAAVYNIALKACSKTENYQKGMDIHHRIQDNKCMNQQLRNTLIDFYGRYKDIETAMQLYDGEKDTISLNAMMTALVNNYGYENAINLYEESEQITKDCTSHLMAIKACSSLRDEQRGRDIIQNISDESMSIELKNALIDFYGIFNDAQSAETVFDSISNDAKTIITVGTMMNVLVNNTYNERALCLYDDIFKLGLSANNMCHKIAIKACANSNNLSKGMEIHESIKSNKNVKVKTALIDFYGHCSQLESAENVFHSIHEYDVDIVAVNALMNAYCINEQNKECIQTFLKYTEKLQPETATFVIALSACTYGDFIEFGQHIHKQLKKEENMQKLNDLYVQINLLNMYGKFAMLQECEDLFEQIRNTENVKNVSIWNAMIYAYGRNGDVEKAKHLFDEMTNSFGLIPDRITFGILLNAYNHTGKMKEIRSLNAEMLSPEKNIKYDFHITSSVIDGLSRSGLLYEAYEIMKEYEKNTKSLKPAMLMSLLSGCKTAKNILIAQHIFDQIKMKQNDDEQLIEAATIALANIYAEYNEFDVVDSLRSSLRKDF